MKVAAIIPARYGSSRFPGKPLAEIAGKTMIARVYEQVEKARLPELTLVATDDERIAAEIANIGGEAMMTSPEHKTGTDRLAEAAQNLSAEIIVNIQGDEPLIRPAMVDEAVKTLQRDEAIALATLAAPVGPEIGPDPNRVKVVLDNSNRALYFSRAAIPATPGALDSSQDNNSTAKKGRFLLHIGLYAYRQKFLQKFTELAPTPLEQRESLEQLRALENGYQIGVSLCEYHGPGVDCPEDIPLVEEKLTVSKNK